MLSFAFFSPEKKVYAPRNAEEEMPRFSSRNFEQHEIGYIHDISPIYIPTYIYIYMYIYIHIYLYVYSRLRPTCLLRDLLVHLGWQLLFHFSYQDGHVRYKPTFSVFVPHWPSWYKNWNNNCHPKCKSKFQRRHVGHNLLYLHICIYIYIHVYTYIYV